MENKSLKMSPLYVRFRAHIELAIYEFRSPPGNKNGELEPLQIFLPYLETFPIITYATY